MELFEAGEAEDANGLCWEGYISKKKRRGPIGVFCDPQA